VSKKERLAVSLTALVGGADSLHELVCSIFERTDPMMSSSTNLGRIPGRQSWASVDCNPGKVV